MIQMMISDTVVAIRKIPYLHRVCITCISGHRGKWVRCDSIPTPQALSSKCAEALENPGYLT